MVEHKLVSTSFIEKAYLKESRNGGDGEEYLIELSFQQFFQLLCGDFVDFGNCAVPHPHTLSILINYCYHVPFHLYIIVVIIIGADT